MAPPTGKKTSSEVKKVGTGEIAKREPPASNLDVGAFPLFVARNVGILALAALAMELNRQCLAPVYGSMESPYHQNWEVNLVALTLITSFELKERRQRHLCLALPVLGCLSPWILSASFEYSGVIGPRWGPLVTSVLTTMQIFYLSLVSVMRDCMKLARQYPDMIGLVGRLTNVWILAALWFDLAFFRARADVAIQLAINYFPPPMNTRFGLQMIVSVIYGLWASRKKPLWMIGLLAGFVLMSFSNEHIPFSWNNSGVNGQLAPIGFALLARQESVTGHVSVLENKKEGYRVMRCDHSLLGGDWLKMRSTTPGQELQEPIYSVFVMLEAIRLIETPKMISASSQNEAKKTALVM